MSSSFDNTKIDAITHKIEEELQSEESLALLKKSLAESSTLGESSSKSDSALTEGDAAAYFAENTLIPPANADFKTSNSTNEIPKRFSKVTADTNPGKYNRASNYSQNVRHDSTFKKIEALYAKGKTAEEINQTIKEISREPIPTTSILHHLDEVLASTQHRRQQSVESNYPIVFFVEAAARTMQDQRLENQDLCFALAISEIGLKQILGLWTLREDRVASWSHILADLKNRGLQSITIACTNDLEAFSVAARDALPQTRIQFCIMQLLSNSLRLVASKERKEVSEGLKRILTSSSAEEADNQLTHFSKLWQEKYPATISLWQQHHDPIHKLFSYPVDVARLIAGTTTIETLNTAVRKACKNRGIFPDEMTAETVIYLSIEQISKKWQLPVKDWKQIHTQFFKI